MTKKVYLDLTTFAPGQQYQVAIDEQGVIVYSECCAERMTDDVARTLHQALSAYLGDLPDITAREQAEARRHTA